MVVNPLSENYVKLQNCFVVVVGVYDGLFEGMPKVRTEKSFASL